MDANLIWHIMLGLLPENFSLLHFRQYSSLQFSLEKSWKLIFETNLHV